MTLGEELKALRAPRRWTQLELARRAQIRHALISELEANKKTDTTGNVLRRLAWSTGVSVDFLVGLYDQVPDLPAAPPPSRRRTRQTTP